MIFLSGLLVGGSARAQIADSSRRAIVPPGAFVGFIKSSVDSGPVRAADIRLYFMDSARVVREHGVDAIETFIDTARSRLGITDSAGYFTVWRLAAGRYLMHVRRIGFSPSEAIVTVDTGTLFYDLTMTPLLSILSKVEIKEVTSNSASRRLDRVGFVHRSKFEMGQTVKQAEILRRNPLTLRDILNGYGLRPDADYLFDRMPLSYDDIENYPAELIAGIEIYRHTRPAEFNGTRSGPTLLSAGGGAYIMRPLVVIWTYVP